MLQIIILYVNFFVNFIYQANIYITPKMMMKNNDDEKIMIKNNLYKYKNNCY